MNLYRDVHTAEINLSAVSEKISSDMRLLGDRVSVAVSRALRKTERWLRVHSMREIGRELNISNAALKYRYKIETNGKRLKLWFGLLNIAAHETGSVSQNAGGVKVRGRQFGGAFYRRIYGSDQKIYIRTSRNRVFDHPTYTQDGKHRVNRNPDYAFLEGWDPGRGGRGRFPVQVVGVEIAPVAVAILKSYEARINARYEEILAQEINFALIEKSR